jgi:flavin-dependent dehydrogenase
VLTPPATLPIGGGALPVEATADLLVLGGSYGGCAAALAAARAGRSVVLAEPRTYLGYETSALLRPWLPRAALESPPALFAPWLSEAAPLPAVGDEVPLYPDAVKLGLEDALLAAGVRLLYASHPIGAVFEGGRVAGAVVGNKSGRQVILAGAVVDATDWAVFARLAGAPGGLPPDAATPVDVRRTLEFTAVAGDAGALGPTLAVPAELGLAHGLRVRPGYLGAGHVLAECRAALPLSGSDVRARMAVEVEARRRSMAVAAHLVADHPAFRNAFLAHTSWEAWVVSPWRLDPAGQTAARSAPGQPALFVLGSAAPAPGETPASMLDPLVSARAGEALAPHVLRAIADAPPPAPERCLARCGAPRPRPPVPGSVAADLELREQQGVQRGRRYARVPEAPAAVPVLAAVDVLVVGGGTSGATAGAVAAGQGARTAILELNSGLGGTGTVGGVDSYWYGRRVGFTATVDRYYEETAASLRQPATGRRDPTAEASRRWNVEAKMHGLLRWTGDAGAELFFRSTVVAVLVRPAAGGARPAVCGVLAATPDGLRAVLARVTVDASGDADVAAFAGAETVYGSARDRLPLWYSLAQFVRPGLTRNNFTSSVDVGNAADYTRAILAGRRRGESHDHGAYVAPRESRHIVGGVTLTLTDQLTLRRFPDTVAVCFSNSDIKGKSAAEWVLWGLLPPNVESEVPYRAVVPRDLDGLLVCGKAMSCTHDALPAIRMQADLQNLGGACALAAAAAVRQGVHPRDVPVPALQRDLARLGALPPAVLDRPVDEPVPTDAELRALVDGLTGDEPFYIDMGFDGRQTEPMILVRLGTAGARVVPLLEDAYRACPSGKRQLLLARLLAWYGSPDGLETLAGTIERGLAAGTLPARESKIRHAGLPPDQGAMPDLCYLIFTLGMVRAPAGGPDRRRILRVLARVVDCVRPRADDFRDRTKGVFHYVEAVCHVSERLGDPEAVPLLRALHGRDGLHDLQARAAEADFFLERMAYLEVTIGRALARCGAPQGVALLASYLDDARAVLAEHAHDELVAVTGQDFGKDAPEWGEWLRANAARLRPVPWTRRLD